MAAKKPTTAKQAAAKKTAARKKKQEEIPTQIKLADFVGRKLVNIGHPEEGGPLVLEFDNGHNIKVSGDIALKKEKRDDE